ncbi:MAG: restriction endonuclease subunit S, partial [Muribaculaceae bacterium]|nr:restriction endonuclease subunit S [Muribaculaceae bacterium]
FKCAESPPFPIRALFRMSHYGNFVPPFEIPDSWQWVRLGDLSEIKGGTTIPKELELDKGILPYIKVSDFNTPENAVEITTSNRYVDEWKCNQVIKADSILFPKRGGAIFTDKKRITRIDILADLNIMSVHPFFCFEFVFLWFNSFSLSEIQSGSNIPQINNQDLEPLMIPLPPIEEQIRICNKANSLLSIVNNLYDNKHDLKNIISIAKSKILELAMQGKLVPQDSADEPAAEMLRRVNPKARIICDTPHFRTLPRGWVFCLFKSLIKSPSSKPFQIQQSEILSDGDIPVISQSTNFIEGYCRYCEKAFSVSEGIVIFGDHTRIVKYYDKPFVVGADGVKLIEWDYDRKFLYYITLHLSQTIPNRGYSRHFQFLTNCVIGLPPVNEQRRIVSIIEHVFSILENIEASLQS